MEFSERGFENMLEDILTPTPYPDSLAPRLRVGLILTQQFTLLPVACFIDFLRHAADEADFSRQIYCTWKVISHDFQTIRASCGIDVLPQALFDDPQQYDYVVVAGGLLHSSRPAPAQLYEYLRGTARAGVTLVGLCTGQFCLADAGLLQSRRCAIHFTLEGVMATRHPDVITVTDSAVVQDGPFITCPGGVAAIDLAIDLITRHCGKARAAKGLHYMLAGDLVDRRSSTIDAEESLALSCNDHRLVKAVGLMRQRLSEPVTVSVIAERIGTTERLLTRLFLRHLKTTPAAFCRNLRLTHGHWLILNTDRSITEIACECGFTDSSHFIRCFRRRYGQTPSRLRRQHTLMSVR